MSINFIISSDLENIDIVLIFCQLITKSLPN